MRGLVRAPRPAPPAPPAGARWRSGERLRDLATAVIGPPAPRPTASSTRSWTSSTRALGVDDDDPLRVTRGDLVVGGRDRPLEARSPRPRSGRSRRRPPAASRCWPRASARSGSIRSRTVRSAGSRRSRPRSACSTSSDPEAPGGALVGDGRVDEPIADHVAALRPAPARSPARQSSARAAQKSSSSARGSSSTPGSLSSSRIRSAGVGASRLAKQQRVGAQRLGEQRRLGGLARAVDALERDEHAETLDRLVRSPNALIYLPRALDAGSLGARGLSATAWRGAGRFGRRWRSESAGGLSASADSPFLAASLASLALLALLALLAHLDHRRAVVVEAELPGPAAEALHRQPRHLAADRAALLEPPQLVAAAREAGR